MTLSQDHRDYLLSAAIRPEIIDTSGIYTRETEPTGIVFPWNDGNLDEPLPQLRPDVPKLNEKGKPIKYRFPAGSKMILNKLRDCGDGPALIVEGTKQQYTGLSYAPEDFAVYGLAGCWCWTDADLSWSMGRDVYVLFDGDVTSNKDVHQAATEFAEALGLNGASSVRFVRTTARGKDGLDDVLAKVPEDKRAQYLELWIGKALDKLPKAPAKAPDNPFFDKSTGFQVLKATTHLLEEQPAALTAERKVALYLGGAYHIDGTAFLSAVGKQLGDQFRPAWRSAMEEMAIGLLFEGGKILPERSAFTMLNCKNGMLDLRTLELVEHNPEFMSTVQVNVEWDLDARCPVYEAWLADVCPAQTDDLEEVAGTMLDPTRTPHKAAFLFGPSRSGKSTFLRLLQEIAGVENRTAVTLHDLSKDRFAAANVYGKMLNSAADLSSAHVEDLSVFKMMTGEDPIHGNRKYGSQFTFTNQALFAFSANELPTVTESSRAYAERIKPFEFPHSFAGREDPALETKLRAELPGILVRWVKAYRRVLERGGYTPTDARVRREFDTRSDRVAQWVADVCQVIEATPGQNLPEYQCTGRRETARAFNTWAMDQNGHKMGERKIFDRLGQIQGVVEVRAGRSRTRAFNIVVKDDPDADLRVSPEPPKGRAEVRAVRAVSEHPSHTPSPLPTLNRIVGSKDDLEGGGVKVHGKGVSKLPALPVSATGSIALGFDLETVDADKLFTGGHEGPFVRLGGVTSDDLAMPPTVGPSADCVIPYLNVADTIYGHNVLGFDLLALAHHHGADYDALADKAVDTQAVEYLVNPPLSKGMPNGYYKLDTLAGRYGVAGKTHDLAALARKYGGYDKIPVDDQDYNDYLRGDLAATKAVWERQQERVREMGLEDYAAREMAVAALQNRVTLNGWAVDAPLLKERAAAEDAKRLEAIGIMAREYGVPTHHPDRFKLLPKAEWPEHVFRDPGCVARMRELLAAEPELCVAQGVAVRIPGEARKKPWSSAEGKAALIKAFNDAGADHVPRTPKSNELTTSADALGEKGWYCPERKRVVKGMLHPDAYGHLPGVRAICEVLALATGARAKYAEMLPYVTSQGRVHPQVGATQGSGRWAYVHPSTSTMGKRGAAAAERDVMVADPGHMMLTSDHSQLDVRTVAALSQDRELIAMLQPDADDYHEAMADVYFGDRSRRNDAKPINHGVNYGQGARAIALRNGLAEEMVAAALAARGDRFQELMEWTERVRAQAEAGQLLDNGFGRLMRADPDRAYTQAPALMGQGASRDVMCESMLRLDRISEGRVRPYLRGVIHDEIVLSVPEGEVAEWQEMLREAMTWEWKGVPILCDVSKPAFRWSECK